jgi:hypothetical protein
MVTRAAALACAATPSRVVLGERLRSERIGRYGQRECHTGSAGVCSGKDWGGWMTIERWLTAIAGCCMSAAGCSRVHPGSALDSANAQPSAGSGTNPPDTVGHLAGIEAAGLTGDPRAMRAHVEAMHKNMMRDMRLTDPSRPINHEAARAALRPLPGGVQSSAWINRSNMLVMVGGGQYRNMQTINRICRALEPLSDTLSVVVNVQDVTATTSEGADTISRNCQLGAGERAMFQQK